MKFSKLSRRCAGRSATQPAMTVQTLSHGEWPDRKEDIIDREIKRVEMLEADRRQLRIDFDTSTNH